MNEWDLWGAQKECKYDQSSRIDRTMYCFFKTEKLPKHEIAWCYFSRICLISNFLIRILKIMIT